MKSCLYKIVVLINLFFPNIIFNQTQRSDIDEINLQDFLEKIDEVRAPSNSFCFDLEVVVKYNTKEEVSRYVVFVKDATKSLVKFTYPASEKGKKILMVENDMWISFPSTQKPIRISPQQRLVGDASNADIARVVYSIDYEIKKCSVEAIGENKYLRLELVAKTKSAPYGKIYLWVEKTTDTYCPIKAECFSSFDKLLKVVEYLEYQEIFGKRRPTLLKITSTLEKDKITFMKYTNFKLETLPENYFQKDYIKYLK
ncbi:MAG: outer membrane lipoprotein-sorting protein [Endomicrobia bacterium]|nr:outer membrane lipoprotein-sorting protein [Endomicrobiia bacterium]